MYQVYSAALDSIGLTSYNPHTELGSRCRLDSSILSSVEAVGSLRTSVYSHLQDVYTPHEA